jgi:AbrB family looped-hinge helix DNA binding protein
MTQKKDSPGILNAYKKATGVTRRPLTYFIRECILSLAGMSWRYGVSMAIVTTSQKGQVVIPKKEREKVGLKPRGKAIIEAVGDHIEIRPLPDDPIRHYCGFFEDGPSLTEELVKERKKDRGREEKKSV